LTPIIKTDRRFKSGGAHEAVETEALSQQLIVGIVCSRLDALLPEPLDSVRAREEAELHALHDRMAGVAEVLGCVLVRRFIATTDMATGRAAGEPTVRQS